MKLRAYQDDADRQLRTLELFFQNPRVCFQLATGSGKGIILANFLLDGTKQLVITHRRVLLDQIARVLDAHGIRYGLIAAGCPTDDSAPVQLAMVQTLWARYFRRKTMVHLEGVVRVHIDELHQMRAAVANEIVGYYHQRGATIAGYTATPSELAHIVDHVISPISIKELIAQEWLVPPQVFAPDHPDMKKLADLKRQANGEFSSLGLGAVLNVKAMFGRALEHWRALNPEEKPTMLFAPGVPQSQWFAEQFTASGVRAAHIDGDKVWLDGQVYDSEKNIRDDVFAMLKAGDIKLISNRYVLREGVDLPFVSHIITCTSFGVRPSWVQACGRGLRPYEGKTKCIIQDHGGNYLIHPTLDSDEPWDIKTPARVLAGLRIDDLKSSEPKSPEPIVCPKCSCTRISGDQCPHCGHKHVKSSRWVLQVDGKLKLQEGRAFIPAKEKALKTDAEIWKRHFWAARKHRPNRTFNQVYGFVCRQVYRRIPRNLPLMPVDERDWTRCVGELKFSELIGENAMPQNGQYDNRNSGVLFTNNRKQNDKQPDVNGTIDVNGVEFDISGWKGVSGQGRPYIKLRVRPPQPKQNGQYNGQQNGQQNGQYNGQSNGYTNGNGQYQPAPQQVYNQQYAPQPQQYQAPAPQQYPPQQAPQQYQPQSAPAPQQVYQQPAPVAAAPAGAFPGFGV